MKISILSSFQDSMQKDTGASVRIYNIAKGLASRGHDVKVILPGYMTSSSHVDGVTVHKVKGLTPIGFLKIIKKFVDVLRPTALYFYDFFFLSQVISIIRDSEIVQIEQPSSSGLLFPLIKWFLKKRVVVDCHDVFQALRVKHTSNLRRILETFLEKNAYKNADLILTVSDKERHCLLSFGFKNSAIAIVPNGVDTRCFKRLHRLMDLKKKYDLIGFKTIVFVGNFSYAPNREAIKFLSSVIAPQVTKRVKTVKFLIVGKIQGGLQLPGLVFTGFVDNLVEVLSVSDVAVAPLFQGSGTRLKILEYFSCCLPVVSTSIGAEGLNIKNGVNIFIEDNVERFAFRIVELLENSKLSSNVGKAARKLATSTYDWQHIVQDLETNFCSLLSH